MDLTLYSHAQPQPVSRLFKTATTSSASPRQQKSFKREFLYSEMMKKMILNFYSISNLVFDEFDWPHWDTDSVRCCIKI